MGNWQKGIYLVNNIVIRWKIKMCHLSKHGWYPESEFYMPLRKNS